MKDRRWLKHVAHVKLWTNQGKFIKRIYATQYAQKQSSQIFDKVLAFPPNSLSHLDLFRSSQSELWLFAHHKLVPTSYLQKGKSSPLVVWTWHVGEQVAALCPSLQQPITGNAPLSLQHKWFPQKSQHQIRKEQKRSPPEIHLTFNRLVFGPV